MEHRTATRILVTGATSGLGLAVAHELVRRGFGVIGVGRSGERCDAARKGIEASVPNAAVEFLQADLSSLREVRELAQTVLSRTSEGGASALRGLVNNAAAVPSRYTTTRDGLELQIAVNHLAPFLLTALLLPALRAHSGSLVVNVTSGSHRHGRIRWDDICLRRGYNLLRAYAQAKLANLMTTLELAERCADAGGPQVYAFDPGLVNTGIGEKDTQGIAKLIWRFRRRGGVPPELPAAALADLFSQPAAQQDPAVYRTVDGPGSPSRLAADPAARSRMWELSERICGISSRTSTEKDSPIAP